jgi:hypothetical protein
MVTHFEMIGKKFLKGYNASLSLKSNDDLCNRLNLEDKEHLGFLYEGASMAKTILDEISIIKKNRLRSLMSHSDGNKHIYMLHVGAGWAFARLPVSIEKKIQRFDPVLRWLIIDGYGFHQAYFKTKKYVDQMQLPGKLKNSYSIKVFYQGVGRCLWFVDCATPERIAQRIIRFPDEFQPDLWSGVGLACTYACGAGETELIQLKKLAGPYLPNFAQGAVFAAKARQRAAIITDDNELACKIICELSVKEAALIADRCLADLPPGLPSEEQYELWRKSIRNSFIKIQEHETIFKKSAV